jgi:AcrR family transcriptional regulator
MNRRPLAERRAQLIAAALRVAARSGVESVTIRGVAAEAGVSLGTVHYCFQDKTDLLDAMGHAISIETFEHIRDEITRGAGLDAATLVRRLAPVLLASLKEHRQMRLLLLEIATTGARSEALRPAARSQLAQSVTMAQELARSLETTTGVRYSVDVAVLARIITVLIDGVELAWLVDEDDERALEGFTALGYLIQSYLTAPVGAPRTASA